MHHTSPVCFAGSSCCDGGIATAIFTRMQESFLLQGLLYAIKNNSKQVFYFLEA